jgi:hypothetical protein
MFALVILDNYFFIFLVDLLIHPRELGTLDIIHHSILMAGGVAIWPKGHWL